ncbi:tyrosine-protein kinase hopscotch-like isoform X2 [Adelges cooleyi]|uniref:tyrosine-protein kinase hopscotch-like isoform X2 n=1 Tax=Adelges cooleyi TaxID=133065 RepID=UPI00217FDF99|nr:tyrosine-protein kinase hopscotch-like isoform X2 [Adelges cooleyi]
MAPSASIKVRTAIRSEPLEIPVNVNTTVEDVIMETSRILYIGPVARHLFALRPYSAGNNKNTWLNPSSIVVHAKKKQHVYEYKLLYKTFDTKRLKSIDRFAYNYYYHQVKTDLLNNNVTGLCYVTYRPYIIGLGVTEMYREILVECKNKEDVERNYLQYMPKELFKWHYIFILYFLKKPIIEKLRSVMDCNAKHLYFPSDSLFKSSYVDQFTWIAPDYLEGEYIALYDVNGNSIEVTLKINPFHSKMPGIRMCTTDKEEWVHLVAIEDLCFLSSTNELVVEIFHKTGPRILIRFYNAKTMISFLTLLNGYYRLMVNWSFDVCASINTPSLSKLKAMRCHGPISKETSYDILKSETENIGNYMLRESAKYYDNYYVDVSVNCCQRQFSLKITKVEALFTVAGQNSIGYTSIRELLANHEISKMSLDCILPSDAAMRTLLLCKNTSIKPTYNANKEEKIVGPRLISSDSIELIKTKNTKDHPLIKVQLATWSKFKKNDSTVVLKLFKDGVNVEMHLKELLSLSKQWGFISSRAVVRFLGLCMDSPTALVSEYFPLGPLDAYLRKNEDTIYYKHLVESATYMATALLDMETAGFVHGKIRCHKFVVAEHTAKNFVVKLTDPGIHTCYTCYDLYWIPVEFYDSMELAKTSPEADVWALSSTLWELFSYGIELPEVHTIESFKKKYEQNGKMPQPDSCTDDIYHIMSDCWDIKPFNRKKPQTILRDLRQIWLKIYAITNSQQNDYAPIKDKDDTQPADTLVDNTSENEGEIFRVPSISSIGETMSEPNSSDNTNDSDHDYNPIFESSISYNHFFNESTLKEDIKKDTEDDLNCNDKIYQFNNSTLSLVNVIQQGIHGVVFKGLLDDGENKIKKVAVKRMNKSYQMENFQRDITTLQRLDHPNIVKFEGVLEEPNLMLIMEYIEFGSLNTYLKTHKKELFDKTNLLLKYSLDIAQGMEYLKTLNIVHRYLATKNILVASSTTVKINLQTLRDVPLKWHAPEAILSSKYSPKTDVWAFGFVLFEIFSLGREPNFLSKLENKADVESIIKVMQEGHRQQCPPYPPCSMDIYFKLMYPCWSYDPTNRPDFKLLIQIIQCLMDETPNGG